MKNKPTATDANGAAAAKGGNSNKLTIDQKRSIVLDWFKADATVRIRDLPAARPFVRRAATDLNLFELRKLRAAASTERGNVDGIDEMAHGRIMSYRPRRRDVEKIEIGDDTKGENVPSTTTMPTTTKTLDKDTIRSVLISFYVDGDTAHAAPLGRHLRNANVFGHRDQIMKVVKSAQLRKMRREGVDRAVAIAKLDEVLSNNGGTTSEDTCIATNLEAMQIDDDSAADATAVDRPMQTKRPKKAAVAAQRRSERVAARKVQRIAKRQKAKADRTTEVQRKANTVLTRNPSLLSTHPDLKSLVVEWFDHPSKPSIVDFLESKDMMELKRPMRLVCKAGQLQKFCKARDSPGARVQAMHIVNMLFADSVPVPVAAAAATAGSIEGNAKRNVIKSTGLKKSGNKAREAIMNKKKQDFGVAATGAVDDVSTAKAANDIVDDTISDDDATEASKILMKALLTAWYDDANMRPLRKFLKQKDAIGLAPVLVPMAKSTSLVKLRKTRDDADIAALAKTRIDELFADYAAGDTAKTRGKTAGNANKVGKVRLKRKDVASALRQEHLQEYLTEWFYSEDMISVADLVESKGHPELRPVMSKIVKQLGLRQLRKERRAITTTASRRIDAVFKKQTDVGMAKLRPRRISVKKSKVVPSAPPTELMEEDEYVAVAHELTGDTPPPPFEGDSRDDDFVVLH